MGQSLVALQVGVETLAEILTWFGGSSGNAGFDDVATLLGIESCADALGQGAGAMLTGCFSPKEILEVFGAKGLLLAPVMAAGGVVAFFHSELNAIVDQFNGHDNYTVKINVAAPQLNLVPWSKEAATVQVPNGWTESDDISGGSSDIFTFTNPSASDQSVIVSVNRCTGCIADVRAGVVSNSAPAGMFSTTNNVISADRTRYLTVTVSLPASETGVGNQTIQSATIASEASPLVSTTTTTTTLPSAAPCTTWRSLPASMLPPSNSR